MSKPRAIQGAMREAVEEGVRMRKAGETLCSQPAFWRMLRDGVIEVLDEAGKPVRLTVCYAAFRNFIVDVLGYSWPYVRSTSGSAEIVVTKRSR